MRKTKKLKAAVGLILLLSFSNPYKKRRQFLHVIIGTNGTGKTYLALKIAIDYARANPHKRILFVLSDDGEKKLWNVEEIDLYSELETFTGIKKVIIETAEDFEFIAETYKPVKDQYGNRICKQFDGLMICDDLGGAMKRRPEEILSLFRKRRQPNIDFLFMFHGLHCEVPRGFWAFVNHIILFRTSDNHESTMSQLALGKQKEFERVYLKVQRITEIEDPHYCEEIVINPLEI